MNKINVFLFYLLRSLKHLEWKRGKEKETKQNQFTKKQKNKVTIGQNSGRPKATWSCKCDIIYLKCN